MKNIGKIWESTFCFLHHLFRLDFLHLYIYNPVIIQIRIGFDFTSFYLETFPATRRVHKLCWPEGIHLKKINEIFSF